MQSGQIFLSYSRVDAKFALKLGQDLRKAGLDIWIDQFDIPPSEPWDEEIQKGLDASTGLLVILSHTSVASDNVLNEINYALETKKQVWPIVIETNIKKPFNINRLQHIDFTGGYDAAFNVLLHSLKTGGLTAEDRNAPKRGYARGLVTGLVVLVAAILVILVFFKKALGPDVRTVREEKIDGRWVTGELTNPFDSADKYILIFQLAVEDTILDGTIGMKSTEHGKNYNAQKAFQGGRYEHGVVSFYTREESFQGGEMYRYKNTYEGRVSGNEIRFSLQSDRPWEFPGQKFTARRDSLLHANRGK